MYVIRNWKNFQKLDLKFINLETLLRMFTDSNQILIKGFPMTGFTVKRKNDPTRWSKGFRNARMKRFGIFVKYETEVADATTNCDPWAVHDRFWENSIFNT